MATRLPRAEIEMPVGDWDCEGAAEHAAFHVGGHVVVALVRVDPRRPGPLQVQVQRFEPLCDDTSIGEIRNIPPKRRFESRAWRVNLWPTHTSG